jgi:4-hydroxy-tetrahydrodipicolinate reductase
MTQPLKIGIAGCAGRMGKRLMEAAREHPKCQLSAASARSEGLEHVNTYLQREGLLYVVLTDRTDTLAQSCDAVIDFTSPDYSLLIAQSCAQVGTVHICGTTGFSEAQRAQLEQFAQQTRIVWAANFSIGVNLLTYLTAQVAGTLGDEYDIEITETHHRYKKDAPSGTALALGDAAAQARDVTLDDVATHGRHGLTGEREPGAIGFHARRGGGVIGDHTVMFAASGERIELSHLAQDRRIYADGALRAALWAQSRPYGLYSMKDVLFRGQA